MCEGSLVTQHPVKLYNATPCLNHACFNVVRGCYLIYVCYWFLLDVCLVCLLDVSVVSWLLLDVCLLFDCYAFAWFVIGFHLICMMLLVWFITQD